MKTIRKLNVFLLVVAIILMIVFSCIDAPKEKYGNYDSKISVTETNVKLDDVSNYYSIMKFGFKVQNNGNLEIENIKMDVVVKDIFSNKQLTFETSCSFNDLLESNSSANLTTNCYIYSGENEWILNKKVDELLFTFKIKSIMFGDWTTYDYE